MTDRTPQSDSVTGASMRAFMVWFASAFRGKRLMIALVGAVLMAAAGAWAGARLGLDDLELRPPRGPHLRVLPGQGGKASVTIP
jgi:hypothetical protein